MNKEISPDVGTFSVGVLVLRPPNAPLPGGSKTATLSHPLAARKFNLRLT